MGNVDDPQYRTSRIAARSVLLPLSSTPPGTPFPFNDSVDSTHPANIDFILPANLKPNFARLSVKFRLFRTYSSVSLTGTGTDASGESGHTHSHNHGFAPGSTGAGLGSLTWQNGAQPNILGPVGMTGTDTTAIQTNAAASSGHSHSHSHTVSGTTTLGVVESGTTTTISAIAVDGADVTAQCPATATTPAGGPWAADFVELDLTSLMPVGDGGWHVISLTATGLGRIIAALRLG